MKHKRIIFGLIGMCACIFLYCFCMMGPIPESLDWLGLAGTLISTLLLLIAGSVVLSEIVK